MNEIRTYQTRLDLNCEQAALLDANAALYGKAERSLFARLSAGESLSVLKREFIGGLGITARQFNALAAGVRGKIASVKEVRDRLIEFAKRRIKRAEDVLAEIPDKWKRHQKRRRIAEEAGLFNTPIPGGTSSCEHGPPRHPASLCRCDPGTRTVLSTVRRTSWAMGINVHVSRNG